MSHIEYNIEGVCQRHMGANDIQCQMCWLHVDVYLHTRVVVVH